MCSLEFPDLETELWQKYRDQGVVVLGMSGGGLFGQESAATLSAFVEQTGVTFPILREDQTYFEYDVPEGAISPFPLDVIIDRQGTIRYLRHEFDGAAMDQTIQRLLTE